MHTLLDIRSAIPEIVTDTHGKVSDVQEGRALDLSTLKKGSILVMDRGYCDYAWWRHLSEQELFFVTRPHPFSVITPLGMHREACEAGVVRDERVRIGTYPKAALHPEPLRLVTYVDPATNKSLQFITNNWELSAATIEHIYKERWQIEIFFGSSWNRVGDFEAEGLTNRCIV